MNTQIDRLGKVSITVEKDYWDGTKCYDKLVIVEKENDCAYLSRKPVPAGISVADREYWIKIGFNTSGGGINVTTTFTPNNVNINETTTIAISVTIDSDADVIKVKRGTTVIGSGSGSTFNCSDTVTPTTTNPIRYEVEVTIGNKVVTKSYSVTVNAADAGISWPNNTVTMYVDDVNFQQLINPNNLSIIYSSSNTNVATIDSSTGNITIVGTGTTVIKAKFSGNSEYSPKEVSYTLIIKEHESNNLLLHIGIPINNTTASEIVNNITSINSLINETSIEENVLDNIEGYILDDYDDTVHTDEITINVPNSIFFIEVFLLSNVNHKIINYFAELGVYIKDDIETQRFQANNSNTIYQTTSYNYKEQNYKLLAILRKKPINTTILIQEIK